MRGVFITLEGPEGSGKSTQAERLTARLRTIGYQVLNTREPGGTPVGEAIRNILQHDTAGERMAPEAEALLFAASRAELVRRVILPALGRGVWVVCDRFEDSTTAYQGYGRGLGADNMIRLNAFAVDGAAPDITFLLDLDVRRGFERMGRRNASGKTAFDRIEREGIKFHERVRAGYLELAKKRPERFIVIDADQEADVLEAELWRRLGEKMNIGGN